MSLITALTLAGFSTLAHAESPFIDPVSLADFSEWNLADKTGRVGSVEIDGSVEVTLYTDKDGVPTLKTFMTTEATEEGDPGDLITLRPDTSLIVVSEEFAKDNDLEIKTVNKRLIPVPEDFKVGGEIKYVNIPSINVGGLILNDVTALISGSEKKLNNGANFKGMTLGLGAVPTSYAILHSKGVIKFSNDGSGLMSESGAESVPYQSTKLLVGTMGKKTLFGTNQTILPMNTLIVDATFGDSEPVSTALRFELGTSLDKYVETETSIYSHVYDIRADWLNSSIGETTLPNGYVSRVTYMATSDQIDNSATLGYENLIGFDIVVDKTSETIGFVKNDGFTFTPYYPIYLEEARKELEDKEETDNDDGDTNEDSGEESAEDALNVKGINGLIDALETGAAYSEALDQYALLLGDEEEKTDCRLWLNYGHAQRMVGNLEEAHKAYVESAALYHSWWDIDLGRRMDINKAQGKMEEAEIKAAKERSSGADNIIVVDGWYISQPEVCYRADGWVATVDLLNGNHDAVEQNYRNNLDLDALLAMIFGNSALQQGKTAVAHEAYRQAVKLEDSLGERALNRHGLALIYADQGKWEQANDLFQESMQYDDHTISAMMWLNNAIAQSDAETGLALLQEWSATHPNHLSSRLAELQYWSVEVAALTAELNPEPVENVEGEAENSAPLVEPTEEDIAAKADKTEQLAAANTSLEQAKTAVSNWLSSADQTLFIYPYLRDGRKILAYSYLGEFDKAVAILESVKGHVSTDPALSFAAANYYALSGQSEKSAESMEQFIRLMPHMAGAALAVQ